MRLQGGRGKGKWSLRRAPLLRAELASIEFVKMVTQCDLARTKLLLNPHSLCLSFPIPVSVGKLLHLHLHCCYCGVERFRTISDQTSNGKETPSSKGDDAPLTRRTKRAREKSFSTCGQDFSLALLTVSGQSPLEGQGVIGRLMNATAIFRVAASRREISTRRGGAQFHWLWMARPFSAGGYGRVTPLSSSGARVGAIDLEEGNSCEIAGEA
ncbi:hypothetical protein B0I37DRAFT_74004 [Chaetomium sp. MPI-CAGE-AT-0009]|nr:hypothetical protein B0I37DRAFT_74004 [Chaetomium sp. MPI-CAGE-AT-0009]